MLNQTAVGLSTAQTFHYTWRDVILYNLSVEKNTPKNT